MPNQRISQGASAYFGMPIEAMMKGSTASVARCERRSRNGSSTPATAAIAKPGGGDAQRREDVGEHLAAAREFADALRAPPAAARRTAARACARRTPSASDQRCREQQAGRHRPPTCARRGRISGKLSRASADIAVSHACPLARGRPLCAVIARPPGSSRRSPQILRARRCPSRCAGAGSGSRARRRCARAAG